MFPLLFLPSPPQNVSRFTARAWLASVPASSLRSPGSPPALARGWGQRAASSCGVLSAAGGCRSVLRPCSAGSERQTPCTSSRLSRRNAARIRRRRVLALLLN